MVESGSQSGVACPDTRKSAGNEFKFSSSGGKVPDVAVDGDVGVMRAQDGLGVGVKFDELLGGDVKRGDSNSLLKSSDSCKEAEVSLGLGHSSRQSLLSVTVCGS